MCEHTEQLDRIEAKLDQVAGFCDLVKTIAGPWLSRKLVGRVTRGRVRLDTQWQEAGDERN